MARLFEVSLGNRGVRFGRALVWGLGVAALWSLASQAQADPGKWTKVGGPKGVVVSRVLGGSGELYATEGPGLDPTGDIHVHNPTSNTWTKIGGPGKNFVVGPSTALQPWLVALSPDKKGIFMMYYSAGTVEPDKPGQKITSAWVKIGGAAGEIYGGGAGIFATNPDSGDLMRYEGQPTAQGLFIDQSKWTKVGGPGKMFVVNNKHLYALSPDAQGVFEYSGTPGKWTKIGGSAGKLYAGGDRLFATNPDSGDIMMYNHKPFSWTKAGGPGKMFAVTSGGSLFALSPDAKGVFRFLEKGVFPFPPENKWEKIGGAAGRIFGGGLYLYATNPDSGDLMKYE